MSSYATEVWFLTRSPQLHQPLVNPKATSSLQTVMSSYAAEVWVSDQEPSTASNPSQPPRPAVPCNLGGPKWKGDLKKPFPSGRGLPYERRLNRPSHERISPVRERTSLFLHSYNQLAPVKQLSTRKSLGYRTIVSIHWLIVQCLVRWVRKCDQKT